MVLALFVTVQNALLVNLRIAGVHPDIMVLLPIVAGILGGPSQGAQVGFASGLIADLFLVSTPFGLSALVGTLVGFGVGVATVALNRSATWLPPVVSLLGSAVAVVAYGVLGVLLGHPEMLHVDLGLIVAYVAVVNALLALPTMRLLAWCLPDVSTEGVPTAGVSAGQLR